MEMHAAGTNADFGRTKASWSFSSAVPWQQLKQCVGDSILRDTRVRRHGSTSQLGAHQHATQDTTSTIQGFSGYSSKDQAVFSKDKLQRFLRMAVIGACPSQALGVLRAFDAAYHQLESSPGFPATNQPGQLVNSLINTMMACEPAVRGQGPDHLAANTLASTPRTSGYGSERPSPCPYHAAAPPGQLLPDGLGKDKAAACVDLQDPCSGPQYLSAIWPQSAEGPSTCTEDPRRGQEPWTGASVPAEPNADIWACMGICAPDNTGLQAVPALACDHTLSTEEEQMTRLYDQCGSWDIIGIAMTQLYDRLYHDPQTAPFFAGRDKDRLISHMTCFVVSALSGMVLYKPEQIFAIHKPLITRMGLRGEHLTVVVNHVGQVLTDLGFEDRMIRSAAALFESFRHVFSPDYNK